MKGGEILKNRIKEIRKAMDFTQSQFAKELNVSDNYIYMMESGSKPITDKFIYVLCNKMYVNENWLRTGEGEMFVPAKREDRIADITAMLFKTERNIEDEDFIMKIIEIIADMDSEQIEMFKDITKKLYSSLVDKE